MKGTRVRKSTLTSVRLGKSVTAPYRKEKAAGIHRNAHLGGDLGDDLQTWPHTSSVAPCHTSCPALQFVDLLKSGWSCDWLWLIEYSKSDPVVFPELDLKKPGSFSFAFLLLLSHHVRNFICLDGKGYHVKRKIRWKRTEAAPWKGSTKAPSTWERGHPGHSSLSQVQMSIVAWVSSANRQSRDKPFLLSPIGIFWLPELYTKMGVEFLKVCGAAIITEKPYLFLSPRPPHYLYFSTTLQISSACCPGRKDCPGAKMGQQARFLLHPTLSKPDLLDSTLLCLG